MQHSQIQPSRAVTTLILIVVIVSFVSPTKAGETEDIRVSNNKRVQHAKNVKPGETLTGKATFYPNSLNGRETASGDTFRQSGHTAASNKLPLGTQVKVTNLKNGKSTKVTTNDHGPALGSHRIDLSKRAAEDIGLNGKQGKVPVEMKVIRPPNNGGN
jgi:rare lipoprotein A